MLTHRNIVSNVLGGLEIFELDGSLTALSFLPLSHSFERTLDYVYFYRGCPIAYAESVQKVAENFGEVRPHLFVSVPRVYEKILGKVREKVAAGSAVQQKIFAWAEGVAKKALPYRLRRATADRPARPAADPGRQAGLRQAQGPPRRPLPVRHVRWRSPGARPRRVLLGRRHRDLRRVRLERDRSDPHRQRTRRGQAGNRRSAAAPGSSCASPRTARSSPRVPTSCPATTICPTRRPRRSTPRAGSTPATSVRSTTRASSASPTARRS